MFEYRVVTYPVGFHDAYLREQLNLEGRDGWEAVACLPAVADTNSGDQFRVLLKRRLSALDS